MEKALKYRIYPNREQRILLAKTFGCTRFVYNHRPFKVKPETLTWKGRFILFLF